MVRLKRTDSQSDLGVVEMTMTPGDQTPPSRTSGESILLRRSPVETTESRVRRMTEIPDALRDLLATGPLATVVTLDPDGTPHATLGWAGFDGDEIVMATFFHLQQRKLQNVRRDPRVTLVFQAKEYSGQGLWPYAVVQGRVDRITEGGALEVMDRLAEYYIGPGQQYPMRDMSEGVVWHLTVDRIYGQGPWAQ